MRLRSLRIENFRSFEDQTIPFDNYTCFVGPNGSGKSTVLIALNIFKTRKSRQRWWSSAADSGKGLRLRKSRDCPFDWRMLAGTLSRCPGG